MGFDRNWELANGNLYYSEHGVAKKDITSSIRGFLALETFFRLSLCFDFLDVWNWRDNYDSWETEHPMADGMSWKFVGSLGKMEINAAGENAFPSSSDCHKTSVEPTTYTMMFCSIMTSFSIPLGKYWESLTILP